MAEVVEKTTENVEEVAKETSVEEAVKETSVEEVLKESSAEEKADEKDVDVSVAAEEKADEKDADESVAAEENLPEKEKKIINQVEYYFGDVNLNRDKFLLEQVAKDEDGWVPVSVMLTFKRLAALTTDSNVVVDALMKSDSGLLEISEDKLKIRRHPEKPIPEHNEERRKEIMARTAYVKGFPLNSDMDTILKFFADHEKVVNVIMRRYLDKGIKTYKFKGSVFVTFETKEQVEKFIEKEHEYKNTKLICKMQAKYIEEKREENEEKKSKSNKKKDKKQKDEENTFVLPKRSVLYFEGATEDVTREIVREAVEKVSDEFEIAYIDFSKGEKVGHVRFTEEDTAEKFLEKLEEKKLKLKDDLNVEVRTLSEEEEQAFLAKAVENMKNRRNHFSHKKGGHNHHHHGRKRRGGNNDRNEHKKAKNDE